MSAAGDDRWRGGRSYDPHRQRYQGGSLRERSMGGSGGHHHDRHGGHRNQGNNMSGPHSWGPPPAGFSQEQHVPVRGFNAAEAKDALRKGYQAANAGGTPPLVYKPTNKDANIGYRSGPWGSRPNAMVNGKDFFLELRKQVTALQQGGSVAGS
ncbi:hypothetical protein VTO42DRAFT_1113 [Malbranchea cinnamomea]